MNNCKKIRTFALKPSVLVCAALIAFAMIACDTTTNGGGGTNGGGTNGGTSWQALTSINQLDGTWNGTFDTTNMMQNMSEEMAMLEEMGITLRATGTFKTIFSASKKTEQTTQTTKIFFTGESLDTPIPQFGGATLWSVVKQGFLEENQEMDAVINDADHSISITQNDPEATLSDDQINKMLNTYLISSDGRQVKVPTGTMGENTPDIIMTKE